MPNEVLCPQCGVPVAEGGAIHDLHTSSIERGGLWASGWADGNRAVCDFIHRGILRPRDPESEPKLWHEVDPAEMGPGQAPTENDPSS